MSDESELIESYRLLIAELLAWPDSPCLHEGTDAAVADFEASETPPSTFLHPWQIDPRITLRRLSAMTMLANMTPAEAEKRALAGELDEAEQELLAHKKSLGL
jgi:hypothetical protein